MDLYREEIIDHYKNPRNFGELADFDFHTFEVNTLCGDNMEIFIKVNKNKIIDIKFRSVGCAISMAAASMMTETLKGQDIKKIAKVDEDFMLKLLGGEISPARKKCAFLPLQALRKATIKLK